MTYYRHFTLPWVRSTRFGSYSSDSKALSHLVPHKLRTIAFAVDAPILGLSSPLKYTPWHVIRNARHNSNKEQYPTIAIRFQVLLTPWLGVLFSIPSRYMYSISLKTCLGLEVDAPQIHATYPSDTTQDTTKIH